MNSGKSKEEPTADTRRARPKNAGEAQWLSQSERGTVFALRVTSFWATLMGRRLSRPLVHLITAYYLVVSPRTREVSRDWLRRVTGETPRLRDLHRHLLTFVQVTLDRLYFARGVTQPFEIHRTGNDLLSEQVRSGQGAILLGAHLGSFEAMRASSHTEQFPLSIVGHWENARMINALLTSLDPDFPAQVIDTGNDPIGLALTLREKIEEGGVLAIMADRVGAGDKWIEVDFHGEKARFATGPFLLASVLKCPVYLVCGLYFEPNRYELFCEPFAERIQLPRGNREAGLEKAVRQYAERLESYSRRAPNNWFNFFDFWEKTGQ